MRISWVLALCAFSPPSESTCDTLLRLLHLMDTLPSSRHPDDLYKNGIQRASFIPAIELLKSRFVVKDLNSGTGSS